MSAGVDGCSFLTAVVLQKPDIKRNGLSCMYVHQKLAIVDFKEPLGVECLVRMYF